MNRMPPEPIKFVTRAMPKRLIESGLKPGAKYPSETMIQGMRWVDDMCYEVKSAGSININELIDKMYGPMSLNVIKNTLRIMVISRVVDFDPDTDILTWIEPE